MRVNYAGTMRVNYAGLGSSGRLRHFFFKLPNQSVRMLLGPTNLAEKSAFSWSIHAWRQKDHACTLSGLRLVPSLGTLTVWMQPPLEAGYAWDGSML